jgi:hypothetical protein
MTFTRYATPTAFGAEVLDLLLEHEVQNNLPISFIRNERGFDTSDWLLASVKDANGAVVLTAACTATSSPTPASPVRAAHNIVLYETGNRPNNAALKLLSDELKSAGFALPGVGANQELTNRFAEIYAGSGNYHRQHTFHIMRLDKVNKIPRAPGHCRTLREEDMYFMPYWERTFGEECKVEYYDIETHANRMRKLIGGGRFFIWEDGCPVSTASNRRNTENGAVVNSVYTPPFYRGKGYASSVVAELSQTLLDQGHKFCCLFADAENPISCGIYRKIGYYDLCVYETVKFAEMEAHKVKPVI